MIARTAGIARGRTREGFLCLYCPKLSSLTSLPREQALFYARFSWEECCGIGLFKCQTAKQKWGKRVAAGLGLSSSSSTPSSLSSPSESAPLGNASPPSSKEQPTDLRHTLPCSVLPSESHKAVERLSILNPLWVDKPVQSQNG